MQCRHSRRPAEVKGKETEGVLEPEPALRNIPFRDWGITVVKISVGDGCAGSSVRVRRGDGCWDRIRGAQTRFLMAAALPQTMTPTSICADGVLICSIERGASHRSDLGHRCMVGYLAHEPKQSITMSSEIVTTTYSKSIVQLYLPWHKQPR